MSTLPDDESPKARRVWFERGRLYVEAEDGREVGYPLSFFPRLAQAAHEDLVDYRVIGRGSGLHWPRLDEDLSVPALFARQRPAREKGEPSRAARVKAARVKAGLTQAQLAEKLDLSQSLISQCEQGRLAVTPEHLQRVLKACRLPKDWMP